jgi:predicted TIM-barrel fold metal-dependent hydrolase
MIIMDSAPENAAPLLFSPDDHIVEPPWLFERHLPARFRSNPASPRVERQSGHLVLRDGVHQYEQTESGTPCDVWVYEGKSYPTPRASAAAGLSIDEADNQPVTFDEMRPGYYTSSERVADMKLAGVGASVCFPNYFVRFCGQRFLDAMDKDLSLACVKAYNDFVVNEWCADSKGILVPLCIIPLWDVELAAQEVRRNAARGVRAVCFSELPNYLGLPSIHSGEWDPFFAACAETNSVIMIHIGSGSKFPTSSPDAPSAVQSTAMATNSALAVLDWVFSGIFITYPTLRLCVAESQIGWIPYFLQRADQVWDQHRGYNDVWEKIRIPPSTFFRSNISCTFFDDDFGLDSIEAIGVENVLFESDYPHGDTNWPDSLKVANKMTKHLTPEIARKVVWENGAKLFQC